MFSLQYVVQVLHAESLDTELIIPLKSIFSVTVNSHSRPRLHPLHTTDDSFRLRPTT